MVTILVKRADQSADVAVLLVHAPELDAYFVIGRRQRDRVIDITFWCVRAIEDRCGHWRAELDRNDHGRFDEEKATELIAVAKNAEMIIGNREVIGVPQDAFDWLRRLHPKHAPPAMIGFVHDADLLALFARGRRHVE